MEYIQTATADIVHAVQRQAVLIVVAGVGVGIVCYVVWKRNR